VGARNTRPRRDDERLDIDGIAVTGIEVIEQVVERKIEKLVLCAGEVPA
jgi:hypothetical protein